MMQIIAVVIGIVVFIIGFTIYKIGLEILDEGDYFFYVIGFFLLLFVVCGVLFYFILPRPLGPAKLSVLAPDKLLQDLADLSGRPYASTERSISYSAE